MSATVKVDGYSSAPGELVTQSIGTWRCSALLCSGKGRSACAKERDYLPSQKPVDQFIVQSRSRWCWRCNPSRICLVTNVIRCRLTADLDGGNHVNSLPKFIASTGRILCGHATNL